MVDAITTQVVRNRISSLMQEMHYHFYRSGYSTIIRELRDFSCVILDCRGGLIVAPPMFFHAPVYRHLVGKILRALPQRRSPGRHVRLQPPLRGRPAARLRHGVRGADPLGGTLVGFAGSIAHKADVGGTNPGSTSANATEIFQEGLLLPPVKILRAAFSTRTWSGSSSPTAASRNWCAATCMPRWRRHRWVPTASSKPCEQFGVAAVMELFAAAAARRGRGIARRDPDAAGRRSQR